MAKQIDVSLFACRKFLLEHEPVVILSGNEFLKKDGITLTQQVTEYYDSIGNKAVSPVYGEVILDKKGVDDDFAHGIGRIKAIAFAAVPQIIEKGIVILPFGKYKSGENIVSAMIAAPIEITGKDYIAVVVLRKRKDVNKLYVHEVTIKEKLLAGSSNPTQSLATNQGDIAKILHKIVSAKSE